MVHVRRKVASAQVLALLPGANRMGNTKEWTCPMTILCVFGFFFFFFFLGKRPISINNEKLFCPGHRFDKAGQ